MYFGDREGDTDKVMARLSAMLPNQCHCDDDFVDVLRGEKDIVRKEKTPVRAVALCIACGPHFALFQTGVRHRLVSRRVRAPAAKVVK